jgi:Uma2 family endonuclease
MRAIDSVRESRFTILDYERLPEGFPCELIEGAFVKQPSPTPKHQNVIMRLTVLAANGIGTDRVVGAPLDVVLDDFSVLQPDVALWLSAPDWSERWVPTPAVVVEVLSPSTTQRDREQKTRLYLEGGVAEVWLVDPDSGAIEVHTSGAVSKHTPDEVVTSSTIPELSTSGSQLTR